jgi:thiamine-monophosphate kinase
MKKSIEPDTNDKNLSEFDIIAAYFQRPAKHASILKTIGDDCALLHVPENYRLALSMDTLVAGRHFPVDASPAQIASRAFCTALSDLAAMGAVPRWFTLALTLPCAQRAWLASFSQSLFAFADQYHCELIGGDTTQGPLTITIQVHGFVENNALTRDGASAGETVFVTGTLGDGRAALDILLAEHEQGYDHATVNFLTQRFYQPEPQINAGLLLRAYASAAIDVSDGLLADLQHIANASQVNIDIETEKIPLSFACEKVAGDKVLSYALTGGDDYQLAFVVPDNLVSTIEKLIDSGQLNATAIGKTLACQGEKPTVRCYRNSQLMADLGQQGYQHFAS